MAITLQYSRSCRCGQMLSERDRKLEGQSPPSGCLFNDVIVYRLVSHLLGNVFSAWFL